MKQMKYLSVVIFLLSFFTSCFASPINSPEGYWKTIDDVTGKPKSIVKIFKGSNNLLMGQVIKIYPSPGKDEHEVCVNCKGDKKNQPIVGMVILSGLEAAEQHQWQNGQILDPQNGKTYSCAVQIKNGGNKLKVRGYIGLPLLGRSQTWQRVDLMDGHVV